MISLEVHQRKWVSSCLEGRNSWMFSSCGSCSREWQDLREPLWCPQERPVPMGGARGPLGIPLQLMSGPKTLCGMGPEPEDSSPVLTWILGYFWSLPRGFSPRLEWGHARALSSRAVTAVSRSIRVDQGICGFPSRLSHEDFPRGFPTGLSHLPPWCESILGVKVRLCRNTGSSGMD